MKLLTWGENDHGGNFENDSDDFIDIFSHSNGKSFAALKNDKTVVTWGDNDISTSNGENSTEVQHLLKNIIKIASTERAFAALRSDGTVITWGNSGYGGDSSSVKDDLVNIVDIKSISNSFLAINANKETIVWGGNTLLPLLNTNKLIDIKFYLNSQYILLTEDGFKSSSDKLVENINGRTIKKLYANRGAFAVLLEDGDLIVSGSSSYGGNYDDHKDYLVNVKEVYTTDKAFLVKKRGNQIYVWGHIQHGGGGGDGWNSLQKKTSKLKPGAANTEILNELQDVSKVCATAYAFAVIKKDGTVFAWGHKDYGGDISYIEDELINVREIYATQFAFTALKKDGTVISWGDGNNDNRQFKNISKIFSNNSAFSALACKNHVDICGVCDGDGLPKGFCDCEGMIPDIDGTCHPKTSILVYIIGGLIVGSLVLFYLKYRKKL